MPLMVFNTPAGVRTVLPFVQAHEVVMEWRCPLSGRRVDLALLDQSGHPVLLVEVWHTHAVDDDKRSDLAAYWWIEVEAKEILLNPDVLIVRSHGNMPSQLALEWEQLSLLAAGSG